MNILILADIHANLAALEAVLAAAGTVDAVWNLGDSVGYGPRPVETLAQLATLEPQVSLVGNHDLAAVGLLDLATFNAWARAAARWTAAQLGRDDVGWLTSLPGMTVTDQATLAHGSPRDPIWEYVTTAEIAAGNWPYFNTPICWVGHTHVPAVAWRDERGHTQLRGFRDGESVELAVGEWLINPGSVGQPRDGDPRASFAVLDTDAGRATNHRVAYDVSLTQQQMVSAGLPGRLIERLSFGV